MEHKKRRRVRELAKDLAIVLLVLSAIYLTARTQLAAGLGDGSGWMQAARDFFHRPGQALQPGEPQKDQRAPIYPARIIVTNGNLGRYGVQYDSTETDRVFGGVFSVLGEALEGAGEPQLVTEERWQQALTEQAGVYFDFLGQYPLETVLAWLVEGGRNPSLSGSARRLALAADQEGTATLYYHNAGDGLYYACGTSGAVSSHLAAAVENYGRNDTTYAFERSDAALYPYVTIQSATPSPKVYQAANPVEKLGDEDALWAFIDAAQGLNFHAQNSSPYLRDGIWVVPDGRDSLRVGEDGTVVFHAEEFQTPHFPVAKAGETPTKTELLDAAQQLVAGTIGARCGDARIYLIALELTADGDWQADFGYSLNGSAVQLYRDGYGARFLFRNGAVADFTLHFRSYTATAEHSIVLPENQAAAAVQALGAEGKELLLCYEDNGGERVTAGWIAQ